MKLFYLSGAPRISTRPSTESLGPRNHVLGVIGAFRTIGWSVDTYILGDRVSERYGRTGSEAQIARSTLSLLAADLLRIWYNLRSSVGVWRTARKAKPDLIYERYGLFQSLGASARSRGVPWILEVNALLAVEATTTRRATLSRRLAMLSERRTLGSADVIVAVTEELRKALTDVHGVPPEKIVVIPNGVDTDRFSRVPPTSPHEGSLRVGFIGALYSWQRVDLLIDAVALDPEGWEIHIAGSGPEERVLRERAQALGLGEKVSFHGRVAPEVVPDFLANIEVAYSGHAGHGDDEAYFSPLKLWEYLSAGRVVVCSSHAMSRQLVADGYPVVVITESTPDSVRLALGIARKELDGLRTLASEARARVERDHSWVARVQALLVFVGRRRVT